MKNFLRALLAFTYLVVSCYTASAVILDPSLFAIAGITTAGVLFTHPGGVGVSASQVLTYLPEILFFNNGGNQLTNLIVENQNGVIHNWNAAQINAINGYRKKGSQTANDMVLRVGDGIIRNQNVTITAITSAVGAVRIFGNADNIGIVPFKSSVVSVQALTETVFKDFTALFAPTMATITDYFQVIYRDGHQQRWEMEELRSKSSDFQQVEGIILDNVAGDIVSATAHFAAITPVYVFSVGK